jgi:glucoamylase
MRMSGLVRLPRTGRGRAIAIAVALALAAGGSVAAFTRSAGQPTLALEGIAQDPCAAQQVIPVPPGTRSRYLPGSSVLETSGGIYTGAGHAVARTPGLAACAQAAARASRQWLAAGTVPGATGEQRSMATRALLDLRLLARPDGAVVAAWHTGWRYAWPRDSSWVAAALAGTGHPADAYRVLRFLQRAQRPDGSWAARYWPDGAGQVQDGRPPELDATGWVPWAVWSWFTSAGPASPAGRRELTALWPMVSSAADAAGRSLTSDGLPAGSMDYWEDSTTVTLGTAAPLLAGLRAAADLAATVGAVADARRWSAAAMRLGGAISAEFARFGYHRLPRDTSGDDVAVTFLGPPFAAAPPAVGRAARAAQAALTLPDGGVLPGSAWPGNPTVSWTPETAFFALLWASAGDDQRATAILSWLAAHRTRLGELPEQVNGQGQPVSVAPLAWTDAIVLLALLAQRHRLPVPPADRCPDRSELAKCDTRAETAPVAGSGAPAAAAGPGAGHDDGAHSQEDTDVRRIAALPADPRPVRAVPAGPAASAWPQVIQALLE